MYDSNVKLKDLNRKDRIEDTDYLLMDENGTGKCISYANLKKYIVNSLSSILDIGSMAYESENDYAKFNHQHEYSDFYYYPYFGPESAVDTNKDNCECVGYFNIRKFYQGYNNYQDFQTSVYFPANVNDYSQMDITKQQVKVGDVKMLGISNFKTYLTSYLGQTLKDYNGITNIDIDNPNFKGWIIPNGVTITCNSDDFQQACVLYSGSKQPSSTQFTVPNMQDFIRCNNYKDNTNNGLRFVPFNNVVPKHNHTSSGYTDKKIELKNIPLIYKGGPAGKETRGMHRKGSANGNFDMTVKKIELNGTVSAEMDNSASSYDIETRPDYIKIPVLLYIGKKK